VRELERERVCVCVGERMRVWMSICRLFPFVLILLLLAVCTRAFVDAKPQVSAALEKAGFCQA
jgi:ABC-type methionine transport system permease subunit